MRPDAPFATGWRRFFGVATADHGGDAAQPVAGRDERAGGRDAPPAAEAA